MAPLPHHLFRVFSPSSNGVNEPTLFAPASVISSSKTQRTKIHPNFMAEALRIALIGKHTPANSFVFFTPSLLYALQFAAQQKSKGATGIRITCLETSTARTQDGKAVDFYSAPDLIAKYGVQMKLNRDGEACSYEGEWVAMVCSVVPGKGSSVADFDALLKLGLYQLYPELGEVAQTRNGTRLYSALRSLRQYSFQAGRRWLLTENVLSVAARLAAAFQPIQAIAKSDCDDLLAWFLALRKWEVGDGLLKTGLSKLSKNGSSIGGPVIDLTTEDASPGSCNRRSLHVADRLALQTTKSFIDLTGSDEDDGGAQTGVKKDALPEFGQFGFVKQLLLDNGLRLRDMDTTALLKPQTIAKEVKYWNAWVHQSRGRTRSDRQGRARRVAGSRVEKPARRDRHRIPRLSREEYRPYKAEKGERHRGRWYNDRNIRRQFGGLTED